MIIRNRRCWATVSDYIDLVDHRGIGVCYGFALHPNPPHHPKPAAFGTGDALFAMNVGRPVPLCHFVTFPPHSGGILHRTVHSRSDRLGSLPLLKHLKNKNGHLAVSVFCFWWTIGGSNP